MSSYGIIAQRSMIFFIAWLALVTFELSTKWWPLCRSFTFILHGQHWSLSPVKQSCSRMYKYKRYSYQRATRIGDVAFSFLTSADTFTLSFTCIQNMHLSPEHAVWSRLHCLLMMNCNVCQNVVCRPTLRSLDVKKSPDCFWCWRGKGPLGRKVEMSEVFASICQGAGHHAGAGWRGKADDGEIIWQHLVRHCFRANLLSA